MLKAEFLQQLRKELSSLPREDAEERLTFYSEMIDDRMEEGLTEEEAVLAAGPVGEIAEQAVADTPLSKLVREKIRPKRKPGALEIVLLVLGSPVWLSLLIAAVAVFLSLYAVLWALILTLWAVFASLTAVSLALTAAGIVTICRGELLSGLALVGAGLAAAGFAVLLFFGVRAATRGILYITKNLTLGIKKLFIGKGEKS